MYSNKYFLFLVIFCSLDVLAMNSTDSTKASSTQQNTQKRPCFLQVKEKEVQGKKFQVKVINGVEVTTDDVMRGRYDDCNIEKSDPRIAYNLFGHSSEKVELK